jgi:hypothetical protein
MDSKPQKLHPKRYSTPICSMARFQPSQVNYILILDDEAVSLDDLYQIIIEKQSEPNSQAECEIFYFVVPNMNIQKFEPRVTVEKHPQPAKGKNVVDKNLLNRWTADDREQLKKLILQYGYGRWKQLQRSSTLIGGKL